MEERLDPSSPASIPVHASSHLSRARSPSLTQRSFPVLILLFGAVLTAACGERSALPTELDPDAEVEPVARPAVVRGVYVNAQAAGSSGHMAGLLDLVDASAVNTFVIDVKERGEVSYASGVPLVAEIGAGRGYIADLPGLLRTLRERGIYPVARIVCFRDAVLAEARPEWAIRTEDGDVWLDPESGKPWVDPFNPDVWAYNIALAREALEAGFAEIQWDYVRFPDIPDPDERAAMVFPAGDGRTPEEGIEAFLAESHRALAPFDVPITADVFGRVITQPDGSGIGQSWEGIVRNTDVILPMVYPALYWPGNFGIENPNADPYGTVRAAMDSAVVRMARTTDARATIRPWLQAFSQDGIEYGAQQMLDQIRAVEDAGLAEWLFWNPGSVYPAGVF